MNGWNGKFLRVNLSTKKIKSWMPIEEIYNQYLGGTGIGMKIIYDQKRYTLDAFNPENLLIFAAGPLTGSKVYGTGRHSVISISPLTNTIFDATTGGYFGAYLKFTGYDGIIIDGVSDKPVFLYVTEDTVELRDASHLWGMTTNETIKTLEKEVGKNFKFSVIGPAGENRVRMSAIINDPTHAAGRGGLGAVMGAKKLKAIAVYGNKKVIEANSNLLKRHLDNMKVRITWNPVLGRSLRDYGTSALLNLINELGMLPTKNFQEGVFEFASEISGEALRETILTGRKTCYQCPIGCKRVTKVNSKSGDGPEYESLVNLGSMVMLGDIRKVTELNYLCNELGLDTISVGGTLACAAELSEIGVLPKKVNWGDFEELSSLIKDTAYRKDLGNEIADGSKRLATKYGRPELSMSVKNLEMPAYDPRGAFGMALSYGTSYRGACHLRSWTISFEVIGVPNLLDRFSIIEKPSLVAYTQNLAMVYDSLVMCQHYGVEFDEEPLSYLLTAVTGKSFTQSMLIEIGERIWNLARMMNIERGFTKKDDYLPNRILTPLEEGPSKGKRIPFGAMLEQYYAVRGWDNEGRPTSEKLKELNLVYNKESDKIDE